MAMACAALLSTGPGVALAQSSADPTLPEVKVTAPTAPKTEYKVEKPQSPKYTAPLIDTPQTITVIPAKVIEEQNLLTLRDVLSTIPGITFGAGEGGGGYGDSINLRGFAGANDITSDGIRDSAQYTRSDPFNLQSVEVINGASSAFTGAGSVGGSINLVSKVPLREDFNRVSGGLGTDAYKRVTGDFNHQFLDDSAAVRLNVMGHKNNAPGRDVESFERWGVAPSLSLGLGTPTRLTLSYVHQKDTNVPQYGVPYFNGTGVSGVDRSNYYGYDNVDTQQISTDQLTSIVEHDFSARLKVRNLTRYSEVEQFSLVDPPQGTYCVASTGLTPLGASCAGTPLGFYTPSGPRGNGRDTRNTLLTNATDFTLLFDTAGFKHTLLTGFQFSHEEYDLDGTTEFRTTPNGATTAVLPPMNIADPFHTYLGPRNRVLTSKTNGELDNRAIYAFDTVELTPQWLLNAGARWEYNDGTTTGYTITNGVATGAAVPSDSKDHLLSYRVGLVFKPTLNSSVYGAFGNSETPSKNSVNGTCQLVATATAGANCNVDPEKARIYEVGGKIDLFESALSLTGSIFRNLRSNYRVNDFGNPDNPSGQQTLDGRARVQGLAVGISGNLTDDWAMFANYTYLKSKVLKGASEIQAALGNDFTKGDPLTFTPEHAASLWTTYRLPARFTVGYGLTYQGTTTINQHSATVTGDLSKSEAYLVNNAMVTYGVMRGLDLQLNIRNLFDKKYYSRIRNNGWATPGDTRTVVLTANYEF